MRPNILLYIADDQGMDDAGCYGNPIVKTPGLDMLAGEGVRFSSAFCTTASCSPSRSVILTGLHNHSNGQYGLAHDPHHFSTFSKIKTLPIMLASAGYRTMTAGKFHIQPESIYRFQRRIGIDPGSPDKMADKCRSFIAADDPNPFFLCFNTGEPHRPFLREGSSPVDPKDVIVPPWLPDTPECRAELAHYYMSIERGDKGLLRLIQILKETGKWETTLVIFISDNGAPFPGAKTTLYEPGMRLPCVVHSPFQKKRGIVNSAMVSWTDITPTILDFAGALPEDAEAFHGRSFRRILEDENPKGWDEVYGSHTSHQVTMYYPMRAVRTRSHKLIWNIAHKSDYPFASDLFASETWQAFMKSGDKTYGRRTVDAYIHRPQFEYEFSSPGDILCKQGVNIFYLL
ncbi:MAG: sulfatase [Armatimonadota bacterium]|nr:sulfatase [Armatimonadota bacterium]